MNERPTEDQLKNRIGFVAALRSGKYEQGKRWLHGRGCYCFSGVACEVLGPRLGLEWIWDETHQTYRMGLFAQQMPDSVSEALAIGFSVHKYQVLNDNGKTFPELADLFEAEHVTPYL